MLNNILHKFRWNWNDRWKMSRFVAHVNEVVRVLKIKRKQNIQVIFKTPLQHTHTQTQQENNNRRQNASNNWQRVKRHCKCSVKHMMRRTDSIQCVKSVIKENIPTAYFCHTSHFHCYFKSKIYEENFEETALFCYFVSFALFQKINTHTYRHILCIHSVFLFHRNKTE